MNQFKWLWIGSYAWVSINAKLRNFAFQSIPGKHQTEFIYFWGGGVIKHKINPAKMTRPQRPQPQHKQLKYHLN